MIRSLRLGIVPYLNVLPLLEGLEGDFPKSHWISETPRRLGELLESDGVDVAMVSIIEALRRAGQYRIVPGVAIGCDGPVRSVALFSKIPLENVSRVLLDKASLSSANLVKILCRELLEIDPIYEVSEQPFGGGFNWGADAHDAFLVIGDAALACEKSFPYVLDLGEGWKRLTGLPFVFAGWVVREGLALNEEEVAAFAKARDRGVKNVPEITRRFLQANAASDWLSEASFRDYLGRAIRYDFGELQWRALLLFREKLINHGLIDARSERPKWNGE